MYTVYCHIFPNGKRYVGVTKLAPKKRWKNGKGYAGNPFMSRAIAKYGWAYVRHEILAVVDCAEVAGDLERRFISEYATTDPDFGYNILPGGDVSVNTPSSETRYKLGSGWRGRTRTEAERNKISAGVRKAFARPESNGHFGLKACDETRMRQSTAHKKWWAENPELRVAASERMAERMSDPEYREGVLRNLDAQQKRKTGEWRMPEAAKRKLSQQFKGRWLGDSSPCSKPVLQYTKDGELVRRWANAGEAERAGFGSRSNIAKCCRGVAHVHTVGGFVWKYELGG